jgi:hypothetical protein
LASKIAVTVTSLLIFVEQVPAPEQPPPDQPTKWEPGAATAARVTSVPFSNWAEHSEPQAIPAGELVTAPEPVPSFSISRVRDGQ